MTSSSATVVLFGATVFVWGILPLAFVGFPRNFNARWASVVVAMGAILLLASSICGAVAGSTIVSLPPPLSLGLAPFAFRIDRLACWFLALIAIASLALAPYLSGYVSHMRKGTDLRVFWIGLPWLLLSMAVVAVCANAICFLVFWEAMSLTSFLLVAVDHEPHATRQAALIYLGSTRAGTALLAGGFLWAHASTGSWVFADWHLHGVAALGPGLLILCGLGVKAGMWPFHLWLPVAHPAAPAPVSALMSGVMVKVAIAVIVRLFVVDSAFDHAAFGYIILILGSIGALWGVLFALLQHDLKRLLAFHTVENIGLILMGIGASMIARRLGMPFVAEIALAGAIFHVLNHGLFKSLLFLGAGAVDVGTGTRDLGHLGGIGKLMPCTMACFVVGSAAICGLPPLNGFASEWLLYQSFLHLGAGPGEPLFRFLSLLLIGWIALVGALAAACFIKAIGVTFLGRPRSPAAEHAREGDTGMRASQAILAAGCVALGLGAPFVLRLLGPIVDVPGAPSVTQAWTLPLGASVLAMVATALGLWAYLSRAAQSMPARTFITWECGFGDLGPRAQVAGQSYVQPIARMFSVIFRYAESIQVGGANRRLFPDEVAAQTSAESVLEVRVWRPAAQWFIHAADRVLRLQEGSIHRYLITMFATLLILLAIGGNVK